jgi:microcystin-dependent protein
MSEPFIAEIKIFAGNFAPRGYAFCDGQLLPISQNTALFSLVGTTYGGDGRTTFGLPNLMGRAPMHPGNGPGLTNRRLGDSGGVVTVQLTEAQMPNHSHVPRGSSQPNTERSPSGNTWGAEVTEGNYHPASDINTGLSAQAIGSSGGGQAHENRQPFLVLNYIIALVGLYPSRS